MELEQLRTLIQQQLQLLEHDRRCLNIEWYFLRPALQDTLIEPIISLVLQLIKELEKENKRLKSQFNQSSFQSDPGRDKQILKLHRQGLNNSEVGRTIGMTRQGVAKALRRLNGNSVALHMIEVEK